MEKKMETNIMGGIRTTTRTHETPNPKPSKDQKSFNWDAL